MSVLDALPLNLRYSQAIPHISPRLAGFGSFHIETQKLLLGDLVIMLSFYSGTTQRLGLSDKDAEQLILLLHEAAEVAEKAPRTPHPAATWKDPTLMDRGKALLIRLAYLFFPDVLFNAECPTGFRNGKFYVQIERDYFGRVRLALLFQSAIFMIPKITFSPGIIELMIGCLTEARAAIGRQAEEH